MREIKFRQLVRTIVPSGDNSNLRTKEGGMIWHYFGVIDNAWISPVGLQYPIMQFTGLKDKNGKEIYEGDCLGGVWEMTYVGWCEKSGGYEIFICKKECMACSGDVHWYEIVEDKEKEVIGNIYESKHLLV